MFTQNINAVKVQLQRFSIALALVEHQLGLVYVFGGTLGYFALFARWV